MTHMLANIVTPKTSTAQLFFLIAVIVGIIAIVFGFVTNSKPYAWATPVLVVVVLTLIAFGLLFLP